MSATFEPTSPAGRTNARCFASREIVVGSSANAGGDETRHVTTSRTSPRWKSTCRESGSQAIGLSSVLGTVLSFRVATWSTRPVWSSVYAMYLPFGDQSVASNGSYGPARNFTRPVATLRTARSSSAIASSEPSGDHETLDPPPNGRRPRPPHG